MGERGLEPQGEQALEQALGYLNFSAGAPDPQFLANINRLFAAADPSRAAMPAPPPATWRIVAGWLRDKLAELHAAAAPAFRDIEQVGNVLRLLADEVIPGYLDFHRDLLFHQTEDVLINSFFLGRVCEAVLRTGGPWDEVDRIRRATIKTLNDYLGHRPIPQLESRKIAAHPHEWLRPVPLYVRGAGVAHGPAREVVEVALKLLESTDPRILRAACFQLNSLDELAFDPRAYDFDHPVNKRPNYHFGQWDPHQIDQQGSYRRFVVQQVTLDALMRRTVENKDLPHEELVFEAAAVLAGTILMASGVSGTGPDTHHSTVTLSNLLPIIARYRDEFYERLIRRVEGVHSERLRIEAKERQQPFGGARQHLNAELARRRATQLEHVNLAKLFARMGFPEAAVRQAKVVPTASARMLCQIDCWLTEGNRALAAGDPERALKMLNQIVDHLRRGIECGALIDPWNILGFDAHFSLFPAVENSVHDHRADELCALMEQIFELYSHTWTEAAIRDRQPLCRQVSTQFQTLAEWWNQYATHEVTSVEAVNAIEAYRGAQHVVEAISLWHKGGAATGDVAFWSPHADMFGSPKAYALVLEALLENRDFIASMALLIHWLNQARPIGLIAGESSFYSLAEQWLSGLLFEGDAERSVTSEERSRRWKLARKFFDYLEANAEEYWRVPDFELAVEPRRRRGEGPSIEEPDPDAGGDDSEDGGERYNAAYDDVVYRDSTDDGNDGSIFDSGDSTHDELTREAKRITLRLDFLSCLARLWKQAGLFAATLREGEEPQRALVAAEERSSVLQRWADQATANHRALLVLLESIRLYSIPPPASHHDAMIEYDQRRYAKELLMEQIVETAIETVDARRLLLASAMALSDPPEEVPTPSRVALTSSLDQLTRDQRLATQVLAALFQDDATGARRVWKDLIAVLREEPLLYVPLSRGGNPTAIVAARLRQRTLQDLLTCLPRRGLYLETWQLIDVARDMERHHPVGPGAVTEFDELFRVGFKSMVTCLVDTTLEWDEHPQTRQPSESVTGSEAAPTHALIECLEKLTESVLLVWLAHSKTLRLSVLEKALDRRSWGQLVQFIEKYGGDLFTQHFLNVGNVRSILHCGVANWFEQLKEETNNVEADFKLLHALGDEIPVDDAVEQLTLILEAIHENYTEYRDYNSTTTQSDRGEMLYTLLDFLRLRTRYDRIAWNLKPVVWVHEVLVRRGQEQAALVWRQALSDRIHEEADQFMKSLGELQRKYAMRMPTVADRLAERFIRPLSIDRIRALVEPAIREAEQGGAHPMFDLLEKEADLLTIQPTGVGLDVPQWLAALSEEVERARDPLARYDHRTALENLMPVRPLSEVNVRQQLKQIGGKE